MIIFESFLFVLSVIIYNNIEFVNEPLDYLTKILLFQNIYYVILFFNFLLNIFLLKVKIFNKKLTYIFNVKL